MKKILTVITLVFSIGLAQAQIANFDSKTTKTVIDKENVSFTFTLEEVNGNQKEIGSKLKAYKGINNVTINGNDVKVDLPKTNNKEIMQSALLSAGIKTVKVDGKSMPTIELMSYIRDQKSKK